MHAVHIKIHVDAQHIAERKRKHRPENDSTSLLTVSAKARLSTLSLHITPDTLMHSRPYLQRLRSLDPGSLWPHLRSYDTGGERGWGGREGWGG